MPNSDDHKESMDKIKKAYKDLFDKMPGYSFYCRDVGEKVVTVDRLKKIIDILVGDSTWL